MRIVLLILLGFLCGCQVPELSEENEQAQKRERIENKISRKIAIKLKQEKGLIPCGSGGRSVDNVEMLALSFDYRKPLTLEEGRDLLVFSENEFINAVNAEEQIRPYLSNYPFGPKNIQIRIFVQDAKGYKLSSSFVDVLSCVKGICRYKKMNGEGNGLITVYQETFAEAELKAKNRAL